MAVYSNPVFLNAHEFMSMENNNFHYDIIYEITDTMTGGVQPQNIIGLWNGHLLKSHSTVYIKNILITKTSYWIFLGAGVLILDNIPQNPTPSISSFVLMGLSNQDISNIAVPVPFVLQNFYQTNKINYRIHVQKQVEVNYFYPIEAEFKIETEKNYINTALYTEAWSLPQLDLTNFKAAVLANYAGFLPAGTTLYGFLQRYNLHFSGYYK